MNVNDQSYFGCVLSKTGTIPVHLEERGQPYARHGRGLAKYAQEVRHKKVRNRFRSPNNYV